MKYLKEYFKDYILDYVFYMVDKDEDGEKVVRVYCPNCGRTQTYPLAKNQDPLDAIDIHFGCKCFKNFNKQVRFIPASKDNGNLSRDFAGEFSNENGKAVWTGYVIYVSTQKSDYNVHGKTPLLERKPLISITPVMSIKFKNDGTLDCRCAVKKFYYSIMIDDLLKAKSRPHLRTTMFQYFYTVGASMQELKGTHLERYIRECEYLDSSDLAGLMSLHSIAAVRKLYEAGYKFLVQQIAEAKNAIITGVGYGYDLDWECLSLRSKTLEKILKIEPQQLDKICKREDVSSDLLKAVQLLKKHRLNISAANIQIAKSSRAWALCQLVTIRGLKLPRTLKYLRNLQSKTKSKANSGYANMSNAVADYYDYLSNLVKLEIPLTDDVVYPSKFKAAHDRLCIVVKIKDQEAKRDAFCAKTKPYSDVFFEDGTFFIKVIDSIDFLVKEAAKMHNCSAGYVDRICNGEAVLFVIRKVSHPKKTFAMLQLSPKDKKIIQNRGINNCAVPQEVQDFADQWFTARVLPFLAKQEKLKKAS